MVYFLQKSLHLSTIVLIRHTLLYSKFCPQFLASSYKYTRTEWPTNVASTKANIPTTCLCVINTVTEMIKMGFKQMAESHLNPRPDLMCNFTTDP